MFVVKPIPLIFQRAVKVIVEDVRILDTGVRFIMMKKY